jgi:hypothetical protein
LPRRTWRRRRLPTDRVSRGRADPHRDPDQFTFNWNGNLQPQYEPLWLTSKGPALDNLIMQTAGQDALNTALALNLGAELA